MSGGMNAPLNANKYATPASRRRAGLLPEEAPTPEP